MSSLEKVLSTTYLLGHIIIIYSSITEFIYLFIYWLKEKKEQNSVQMEIKEECLDDSELRKL